MALVEMDAVHTQHLFLKVLLNPSDLPATPPPSWPSTAINSTLSGAAAGKTFQRQISSATW